MVKAFYIFRHGETELNSLGRMQGSGMDYPLNPLGREQAFDLAQKLRRKNLQIIYSSPLLRARQTAEIVARELNISVEVEYNLRECFYGKAEGEALDVVRQEFPNVLNNWSNPKCWDIRFPGGESKQEALDRVLGVLHHLAQRKDNPFDVVGVAIHGGTMASLLNYFHYPFAKISNCAAFCLMFDGEKFAVDGDLF